ncbi:MAG: trypsin-like serine protease [Deltaproteobacteria bacterium]|nr:trypsin-like serine protease [Deltaproteobacteria bacterium]
MKLRTLAITLATPLAIPLALTPTLTGCGEADEDAERLSALAQPIVGGYVDDQTTGAVGLAMNVLDVFFFGHCSGSLIAPNVVLTAQHCVRLTDGESPSGGVICGETDFGMTAAGAAMRVTVEPVRPEADGPEFYQGTDQVRPAPGTDNLCGYDIALILLEGKGIGATVATPLVPRLESPPVAGDSYGAIGYGNTSPDGGGSGTRMHIDDNTVTCTGLDCPAGSSVTDREWRGTAPTCSGDSGGPAIDAEGRVMGALSRGPTGCTSSIYGDVSAWRDFIIATTLEAAELGDIDPPYWAVTGSSEPPPAAQPGEECIGVCTEGYACARSLGKRICVPTCDEANPTCPSGASCDLHSGGCVEPPPVPATEDEGGCTMAPHPDSPSHARWLWGWVALVILVRRRRPRPRDCRR